jgi:uncharacterized protein (TIGR00297 family)
MASLLFAFLFTCLNWKQAADCALLLLLFNTLILPWLHVDVRMPPGTGGLPNQETALSQGVSMVVPQARESRLRGYFLRLAVLLRPGAASDPSPGPPPDEVHRDGGPPSPQGRGLDIPFSNPLPTGEGKEPSPVTLRTPTGIILYPISVLALILLYRNHLYIAAAAWAIMALGDGMATVVGEAVRQQLVTGRQAQETTAEILLRRPTDQNDKGRAQYDRAHPNSIRLWRGKLAATLSWNRQKTWAGFLSFIIAGTVGAYVLTRWIAPEIPPQKTLMVCAAGSLLGAVIESLPIALDDNITVPLVVGAFMFCTYLAERSELKSNLPYLGRRIVLAIAVNLAFALLVWALGAASRSGALCGFLLGTAIYLGYGYKSFLLLFAFVLLGSVATRLGFANKAARGIAERRGGARSWRQALANLLAAAFFAILVVTTHHEPAFLIALVATLAEAAGDTVSSEIGQWASDRAYRITTFEAVPAGEDGGISLAGTAAGFAASAIIMGLGLGLGLCGPYRFAGPAIALGAAAAGNLLDSFLGATIQRRGLITNGMVNFVGTSAAGGLALGLALHLGL